MTSPRSKPKMDTLSISLICAHARKNGFQNPKDSNHENETDVQVLTDLLMATVPSVRLCLPRREPFRLPEGYGDSVRNLSSWVAR